MGCQFGRTTLRELAGLGTGRRHPWRVGALVAAVGLGGCSVPMQTIEASRATCAAYGFQPGTDVFADCVMTEQHRHTLTLAVHPVSPPAVPNYVAGPVPLQDVQPVISAGDCIGAVVNGFCHGAPAPGAPMATCHGQMVGGTCTGPMF